MRNTLRMQNTKCVTVIIGVLRRWTDIVGAYCIAIVVAVVRNMYMSHSDNCAHNDNRVPLFFYCDHVEPPGILDSPSIIDYCLLLMLINAHHASAHGGMLSSLSDID